MSGFTALVPSLHAAAERSRTVADDLTDELSRLRRQVDELCTDCWRGRASTLFDRAFAQWDEGARSVLDALNVLADVLDDCGRAYAARDALASDELVRAAS